MYRGRCVVSSPLAQRAARDDLIARRDRQIKSKEAKRQMSEDTLSEDEADLHRPHGTPCRSISHPSTPSPPTTRPPPPPPRPGTRPRPRPPADRPHDPGHPTAPTRQGGQPMVRIGEAVSERLDVV